LEVVMNDRSTRPRPQAVLALAALAALSLPRCNEAPTRPSDPPATPAPVVLTRPALVSPVGNAAIPQNQPEIGCTYHPDAGYGHQIAFRWLPSESSRGIAGYEVVAKHVSAARPVVDTFFPSPGGSTTLTWTSCRSFVTDSNLDGWEWRVRARDTAGSVSDWSDPGTFRFEPCRIGLRQPCAAP
jgi:hypothetical protein